MNSFPQVVACAVGGALTRRAIDRATDAIGEAAQDRGLIRLDLAQAEEVQFEADRRLTQLAADVVPMLTVIAGDGELTDEQRQRCLTIEAAARDQLIATRVMDPAVDLAARQARSRGVYVVIQTIRVREATQSTPMGEVECFRRALVGVLGEARAGARVRALWRDGDPGLAATIALVGELPGQETIDQLLDDIARCAPLLDFRWSVDEDSLLIEAWH